MGTYRTSFYLLNPTAPLWGALPWQFVSTEREDKLRSFRAPTLLPFTRSLSEEWKRPSVHFESSRLLYPGPAFRGNQVDRLTTTGLTPISSAHGSTNYSEPVSRIDRPNLKYSKTGMSTRSISLPDSYSNECHDVPSQAGRLEAAGMQLHQTVR